MEFQSGLVVKPQAIVKTTLNILPYAQWLEEAPYKGEIQVQLLLGEPKRLKQQFINFYSKLCYVGFLLCGILNY